MTTEAKCECGSDDFNARNLAQGERRVPHALNCPKHTNAEAPRVGSWDGFGEKPHPETWPAPAPEPEDGECVGAIGCLRYSNEGHKKGCPRHNIEIIRAKHKAPYPKQGSEEPIDWELAEREAFGHNSFHRHLGRAYLALRAEVATWKEQYEAETRSLRNLVAFARDPITTNYEKPMQGEQNVVRDTLARLFGAEIMAKAVFQAACEESERQLATERAAREKAEARVKELLKLCEQSRSCLADGSQLRPTDREWLISNLDRAILWAANAALSKPEPDPGR